MTTFINILMRRRLVTSRTCVRARTGSRQGMKIDIPLRHFRQLTSYLTPSTSISSLCLYRSILFGSDQFANVEEAAH